MKAKSLTLLLSHYETGRYREIRHWHNGVHRIELQAMVPNIYHSEDLVASPDDLAARPDTDLKWRGGECLSLYWSQGSPEALDEDVRSVMLANRAQGFLIGPRGQELTYRKRMHIVGARTRTGLDILPDMVPLSPHSGVVVSIAEAADGVSVEEYTRWHETMFLPEVLVPELFSAAFELKPMDSADQQVVAHLYFIDNVAALPAFREAQRRAARCSEPRGAFPGLGAIRRPIFTGVYQPVVDGQDPYE